MYKYIYHDNSKSFWVKDHYESPVIFECIAMLLTEADQMLEDALKINPLKNPKISCEIQKVS